MLIMIHQQLEIVYTAPFGIVKFKQSACCGVRHKRILNFDPNNFLTDGILCSTIGIHVCIKVSFLKLLRRAELVPPE